MVDRSRPKGGARRVLVRRRSGACGGIPLFETKWLALMGRAADIPLLRREHPGLVSFERWLRGGGREP
ncbi:hypothetical protein LVJ94_45285 [Pendulispora rubella]|uniref:Uncharacterized protein n=1 Tax=Pendulispora rubella TaxID=2741070 RepID=A0ABZ2L4I1_9BACT